MQRQPVYFDELADGRIGGLRFAHQRTRVHVQGANDADDGHPCANTPPKEQRCPPPLHQDGTWHPAGSQTCGTESRAEIKAPTAAMRSLRPREDPLDDVGILRINNDPAGSVMGKHIDEDACPGREDLALRAHVPFKAPP